MSNNTQNVITSIPTLGLNFTQDLNTVSYVQNNCLKFRTQTHEQVGLDVTES